VVEDDGVTQMQGIRKKIRDRDDFFDLSFGVAANIFTKEDRRFVEVRSLTKAIAKVLHYAMDGRGFMQSSSSTENQILSKEQGVDGGTVRS
jgi:hypothetical protein